MNNRKLTIRITLDTIGLRLLVLGLLTLTLTGSVVIPPTDKVQVDSGVQALLSPGSSGRYYYLTISTAFGDGPLFECSLGYHMASLWEIMDTSNLIYNTSIGEQNDDSGSGPPTNLWGWVRTGGPYDTSSTPGMGNCAQWMDYRYGDGTKARLPSNWTTGTDIGTWEVGTKMCDIPLPVWCVED